MRGVLHVPLSDEHVGFHVMVEVTLGKEDALDFLQIQAREQQMVLVTKSPTRKVPYFFLNNSHGFFTVLFSQVGNFNCMLKKPVVFTVNATHLCTEGF